MTRYRAVGKVSLGWETMNPTDGGTPIRNKEYTVEGNDNKHGREKKKDKRWKKEGLIRLLVIVVLYLLV